MPSRIFLFVKMKISKLINYPTNMCQSCQDGTIPDKHNKTKKKACAWKMEMPTPCEHYVFQNPSCG